MSLYVQMCSCMMIYANLDFSDMISQEIGVSVYVRVHLVRHLEICLNVGHHPHFIVGRPCS